MPELASLGPLEQHDDIPEWFQSKPIPVPFLLNEKHCFVVMEPPGVSGYPPDFDAAIRRFLALNETARESAAPRVFANYQEFADAVDIDLIIDSTNNVWEHVRIGAIYVSRRSRWDKDIYVQLACSCDWEEEHGLQLVFRRGDTLVRVSAQDGHLTHADANDLPNDIDDETHIR